MDGPTCLSLARQERPYLHRACVQRKCRCGGVVLLLSRFVHHVGVALRRAQVVMAQQALDGRHRHGDFGARLGAGVLEFPHMADVVHGRRLSPAPTRACRLTRAVSIPNT